MRATEFKDGLTRVVGRRSKVNEMLLLSFVFQFVAVLLSFLDINLAFASAPKAGFFLPDNVRQVTFRFNSYKNLIVLPVVINDSIEVNLILDTGCRSILLFGKRFEKLFTVEPYQKIRVAGLGDGASLHDKVYLENKVSMHDVLGEKIPIVVVANQNLFAKKSNVHGIIGYDILIKFEIEFNLTTQLITFRPAATAKMPSDYIKIPLRIEDCRPLIVSTIFFRGQEGHVSDLMLDTGSALGLLLKTTDAKKFRNGIEKILGYGLNGNVIGNEAMADKIILETFEIIRPMMAGITWSAYHNYGSVGMEIMKDYIIVLNYCKAYVGFKHL
jgi:hypothetical protein